MKAAASCLLDIHGQHEHQSLLYPDRQLEILDAYGKEESRAFESAGPRGLIMNTENVFRP